MPKYLTWSHPSKQQQLAHTIFFWVSWNSNCYISLSFLKFKLLWIAEFDGVIHVMEEAQKMGLLMFGWLWFFFGLCYVYCYKTNVFWMFRNQWNICRNYYGKIKFMVTHIFRKKMRTLISWLIYDLFVENIFIGIISYHLVCSYNSLWIGIIYSCIVFVNIWVLV